MTKKPSWHEENKQALNNLCADEDFEIVWLNEYHARVLSGITIVDIWTPRMKYNVMNIDGSERVSEYRQLPYQFDKEKVKCLLEKGSVK